MEKLTSLDKESTRGLLVLLTSLLALSKFKSASNIWKMSKSKHLEEIIGRINLKSFENKADMRRKLEALKNETDTIRRGLDELGIMKMDAKEELGIN